MNKKFSIVILSLMLLTACGNKNKDNSKEIKNNIATTKSNINNEREEIKINEDALVTTEQVINVLENAKKLNTEGYRLYKNKKYKEALNKFQNHLKQMKTMQWHTIIMLVQ